MPLRTSSSTTQPVRSPRGRHGWNDSPDSSEGHPGLGTDVSVPQSLQWDEEGSMAGRSVCESEQTGPGNSSSHISTSVAPDGSQVCLYSWGEGPWPLNFTLIVLTLNKITCIAAELRSCVFIHFAFQDESFHPIPSPTCPYLFLCPKSDTVLSCVWLSATPQDYTVHGIPPG